MAGKPLVLLITPTLECGGAERFVTLFCNHVNLELFTVKLVVVNNAKPFFKIRPEVEVIDLNKKQVRNTFSAINKLLNDLKPVVVFTTANHLNLFAAITKGFYNHKTRWIARETSIVSHNSKYSKFSWLYNLFLRKFYKRLDLVICQSPAMQNDLVVNYNLKPAQTVVIENGVVKTSEIQQPPGEASFLTVARLSEEKGIGRILDALSLLKFPYKYFIAGDGPLKKSLEARSIALGMKEKVIFSGSIIDPFRNYSSIHLYLAGSFYEGFPNAVLEANAAGIPVIAFNVPGMNDIVMNGINGFLVKDNDVGGFARAIEIGMEYSFDRGAISERTLREHSVERMTARIEKVIEEVSSWNQ